MGPLLGSGPYRLPLAELAAWTYPFRRAKAAQHDARARQSEVRGEAAWAAAGREERPIAPSLCRPGFEPATAPRAGIARRFELVDGRAPHPPLVDVEDRPRVACKTHVERVRARWERYVDGRGEARQKRKTHRAWVPAYEAHESARRWHRARGDGQRHRAQQVGACGVGRVEIECHGCRARGREHEDGWTVHEVPTYCGIVRMCPGCNVRRAMQARARFAKSLETVLRHAERAGSFKLRKKGGALGQKLITLTLPHLVIPEREPVVGAWGLVALVRDEDRAFWRDCARKVTAAARVAVLFAAWRLFSRNMQKMLREPWKGERRELVGACWSRAFEWTAGEDGTGLGHPHFHLWALEPWIPSYDEHKVESIAGGVRRPSTTCLAQNRVKGAWGWAETMRRERCPLCVGQPATNDPEARAAWLDRYYASCRHPLRVRPLFERRTGMRTWWASALGKSGVLVDARIVNVDIREAYAHPVQAFREVKKPNGVNYQTERVKSVEIRTSFGEVIDYFEGYCVALQDERTWELAGPAVVAGVVEALEGKRLSQASKVNLARSDGEIVRVGFYGIADSYYGGACRECKAEGHGGELAEKSVRVISWQTFAKAHLAAPPLPPATAPPSSTSTSSPATSPRTRTPEADYAAFVNRLRTAEAVERGEGVLARLDEVCSSMRDIGLDALPVYQRGRVRTRPMAWSMRDRMRYAARLARKNKPG